FVQKSVAFSGQGCLLKLSGKRTEKKKRIFNVETILIF
ncbi:hypothetical protein SMU86_02423, partial [Streptococcus mutans U2A]